MAISVETKDCTQLSDAELAEMADICAESPSGYEAGLLSKQAEAWVLITMAREGQALRSFSFCTLERIGGTPCVLVGCASIKRTSKRDAVLRAVMTDQFRRAVLAFPDEDVLVGTRFPYADGFEAFKTLQDIVPRPGHKATGEERAWGRRLAKRFGIDAANYDDRSFVATGDGAFPLGFDHQSLKPEALDPEVVALFDGLDDARGDSLIAFGWAMAEDLAKLS
jgi:nitroreductase